MFFIFHHFLYKITLFLVKNSLKNLSVPGRSYTPHQAQKHTFTRNKNKKQQKQNIPKISKNRNKTQKNNKNNIPQKQRKHCQNSKPTKHRRNRNKEKKRKKSHQQMMNFRWTINTRYTIPTFLLRIR